MGFEQLLSDDAGTSESGQTVTDCPNDGTRLEVDGHGRLVCPFDGWPWRVQPAAPVAVRAEPERDRCPECGDRLVEHRGELVCEFDGWPHRAVVVSVRRGAPSWSSSSE